MKKTVLLPTMVLEAVQCLDKPVEQQPILLESNLIQIAASGPARRVLMVLALPVVGLYIFLVIVGLCWTESMTWSMGADRDGRLSTGAVGTDGSAVLGTLRGAWNV